MKLLKESLPIFFLLGTLILTGCATAAETALPPPTEDVQAQMNWAENQKKWESQNIANYRYTLSVFCNCPPAFDQPVIIEVQDGQPVSITNANSGEIMDSADFSDFDTLDEFFGIVQRAFNDRADEIKVRYDAIYGYPTNISIDYDKEGIDDEKGYTISDFEIR